MGGEIGLYYPYFHVRDDAWLKAAALYLPKVARVRPPDYPVQDSATASVLRDELGFLLDVDPGPQAAATAWEFQTLVHREEETLLRRYRLPRDPGSGGFGVRARNPWYQNEARFAWIHKSQLGVVDPHFSFVQRLSNLRLAHISRFDPLTGIRADEGWVGMHPHLVAVYSCALAFRIARANGLTPVTHDPRLLALSIDWTVDEIAVLLQEPLSHEPPPHASVPVTGLYACAALRAVLPDGIEHVPAETIVRVRRTLSDEFDAFRAHLGEMSEEFAELEGVEDPGILQARLESLVNRDLTRSVRELEHGLRTLGLEPIRAVLGLKSLELPAIAALGAHAVNLSPIAGAGGAIAIQLLASIRTARRTAAERRTSAAGYLLALRRELDPVSAVTRARRALSALF
ncbi:DUF6236 family protein [Microtetraspora malaysiensis]|uniref:DUF6236 family protein n=1 Tax=Microtetraspora malaysiensis TaxID=161358 RepID=UPI003D94EDEA